MSQRDDLIAKYADELRTKCGEEPDMALLEKIVIGLGPSIYNADSSVISAGSASEVATVRENFLVKKLGLPEGPDLDAAIESAFDRFGRSDTRKSRAVIYYLLVKHFGKDAVYA